MLRHVPFGNVFVIRLTAVGRHIDIAAPRNVRQRMICTSVFDRPTATVNTTYRKLPVTHTSFAPTTSAMTPKINNKQPTARAYTEAGHSKNPFSRPTSSAIRGRALMSTPDPMVLRKLMPASVTTIVTDFILGNRLRGDGSGETLGS